MGSSSKKMKPPRGPKISALTMQLLASYKEDAELLYWEQDQGTPGSAEKAQRDFNKSEDLLHRRLEYLERELKRSKKISRELRLRVSLYGAVD